MKTGLARIHTSSMIGDMERVTATIDEQTLRAIRRVAGPQGVSAFLETAARERLARLRLLGLVDELDAKYGAPSKALQRQVATRAKRIFGARRSRTP
jgi:hypothetical protein